MKPTDFGTSVVSLATENGPNHVSSKTHLCERQQLTPQANTLTQTAAQTPIIHVVDDDQSFAMAICRLLKASGHIARSYVNAGDFLLAGIPDGPGCILLEVCLPGPSGLELQAALANRRVPLPVVFLSGVADVPTTVRAMKGGAMDFLVKPVVRETLLKVVAAAIARSIDIRLVRDRLSSLQSCYEMLTPRQIEVFERVVAGKMNKEIAVELGAAERTIKAHRAQVMQKMQVSSVADLVRIANRLTAQRLSYYSQK